jgi:hypothetical protein
MLLVLGLDVAGRPVSASCLVSVVEQDLSSDGALEALARAEAEEAVETAVLELGRTPAVVVIRDDVVHAPKPDDPEAVAAQARDIAVQLGYLDDPDDAAAVEKSLRFSSS